MATPFRFKRSAVQDKRPEISDLLLGEIALNTYDGRLFGRRTGTGSTVTLLTPWSERLGAAAIYYENDVAIGATNPNGRKLYVDGNVEITGVTTFVGIVTNQSTIFATQFSVSGISSFFGNVDIDADLDVDGRTELDITNISETLNVVGVSTFSSDVSVNAKLKLPDGTVSANYAGFGNDDDLKIFHNGSHSIIRETGAGSLYLQSDDNVILGKDSNTEIMVKGVADGAVELYYDNVKKFETTADGIDVTGHTETDTLNVSGIATLANSVVITQTELDVTSDLVLAGNLDVTGLSTFASNVDINADLDVDGRTDLDDLVVAGVSTYSALVDIDNRLDVTGGANIDQLNVTGVTTLTGIVTTGSDVYIGGDLYIADDLVFDEFTAREGNVTGILTVGTTLDADGTLLVTGVSTFQSNVDILDDVRLRIGNDQDLEIFHNSSNNNTIIQETTGGNLVIKGSNLFLQSAGSEDFFKGTANGAVELYYDNSKKFETTADGIDVTGHTETDTLNVSGLSTLTGNVSFGSSALFGDSDTILMGDDDDLQIFHSGVTGNIKNTTGTLILQSSTVRIQDGGSSETAFSASNGVAKLYFENSEKLTTNAQGIDVTGHTETDTLNVSGVSTFGSAVDINSTIDISGQAEFDDVNVSGVATISTLEVTQATTLKHADSVKFTTTGIGVSIANGVGQTAYLEGPEQIWIDPHPVGVGTTSGLVRIRGDLYVDGTQFIVNSDVIELADFVVGIASTVPTNALLDGAGIGIGSESIRKFIRWHNATDSLKSSENWNLASGKHYEIDGTDVLTSDTLGSGVLYSSLETLGVLRGLDVSGVSTFSSLVDVNNRIDVVGGINADQANVTGVSTFGGNITASGDLDVDGTTDLDILNVAETATFSSDVTFTGANYNVTWDSSDDALEFPDNAKLKFGSAVDLQIFHDGSNSYIQESGTGDLRIRSSKTLIQPANGFSTTLEVDSDNNTFAIGSASNTVTATMNGGAIPSIGLVIALGG